MHVLDIIQNSIAAQASLIEISIDENIQKDRLDILIRDNGTGMSEEQIKKSFDPFYTSRKTRRIGLGIPLCRSAALMTGGSFKIESRVSAGTCVYAGFGYSHIDRQPIGDIAGVMTAVIICNPDIDFIYTHQVGDRLFNADTRKIKNFLSGAEPAADIQTHKQLKNFFEKGISKLYGGTLEMKSLEELSKIRETTLAQINMRHNRKDVIRVVVGMGTCGIAAGAHAVINAFIEEVAEKKLGDVIVTQTGCVGTCDLEPVVEVCVPGKDSVTYVKMDADKARKVVERHIIQGSPCEEYMNK